MQIKDIGLGFGLVTIVNHWLGVVLMLSFIVLNLSTLALGGETLSMRNKSCATLGFRG